ncbi:hypothetical protein J4H92_08410 [Leucobacter weissii]|uniref:Signal peptidase I n=1 Tax=Leucobacter weissii TaxID=1983706 RepID=A0A939MS23_9MICO|nr:DUF5684 domain-containing protein [Leucobacter weissii]MBO1901969.1 hypothetical protein [Leucobacter weissii]
MDYNESLTALYSGTTSIFYLVFYVIWVIAAWKVFTKAGYPGWLAIIPIVNVVVIVKIAGYSGWLTLLYLIPIVNIVFAILVAIRLGERFGKGGVFSFFLLWLFQFIGFFIIGFGDAKYTRRA